MASAGVVLTAALAAALSFAQPAAGQSTYEVLHSFAVGENPACALVQARDARFYGTTNTKLFRFDVSSGEFTPLHTFVGDVDDGQNPCTVLQGSDNAIYGTTFGGGPSDSGTIFKFDTTTETLTLPYKFRGFEVAPPAPLDGADPTGLIQASDGKFYGTADIDNGQFGHGVIFKFDQSTSTETVLHVFTGATDGRAAESGVIEGADGLLYGITSRGGTFDDGTVFKFDPSTDTLTVLHHFSAGADGFAPATLIEGMDGAFYGVTFSGGASNFGTVFKIDPSGSNYSILHSFAGGNLDGAFPTGLIQATDGNFYGTTNSGGLPNLGTIFKLDASSHTVTLLHAFSGPSFSDGSFPSSGVIQGIDGSLYGTTPFGGAVNGGTTFRLNAALPALVPVLTGISIPSVAAGTTVTVTLTGRYLNLLDLNGADTISFGAGITVVPGSIVVSSDGKKIRLQIQVAANASGPHDIVITNNPGGSQISLSGQFDVAPVSTITGTVTRADTSAVLSGVTIDVFDAATHAFVSGKSATTDVNGLFTTPTLTPGIYKVRARLANFGTTFHGGGRVLADANTTIVTVTANGATSANIAMPVGGGIVGVIRNASNTPVASVAIDVYDANNNLVEGALASPAAAATPTSDEGGNYSLERRLQPGVYKIRARKQGLAVTFNSGKHTFPTADLVTVQAGSNITVDFKLDAGADIRGTVTDASGNPVVGAFVEIYEAGGFNFVEGAFTTQSGATAGSYNTQSRLPAGTYVIRVRRGNATSSVGLTFYNGKHGFATADPVTVGAGQIVTGKNIQMDTGAAITGTISDGVNPIPGVQVDIVDASTGSLATNNFLQLSFRTNSSGAFDTGPQFATNGQYKVRARLFPSSQSSRIDTFYHAGTDLGLDLASATAVSAPSTTNVSLPAGGKITGTIREFGTNLPLPGATVTVSRLRSSNFSGAFTVLTDLNGQYAVGGLHDGDYWLRADAPGHASAFYSGIPSAPASDSATALPITIDGANSVFGADVNLIIGGGTIRGLIVRDDAAEPVPAGGTLEVRSAHLRAQFIKSVQISSFDLCPGAATACNYVVTGLAQESYIVQMFGSTFENDTATGWYSAGPGSLGTPSRTTALPLSVTDGGTTTANFSVPAFAGGGARTISGVLKDTAGNPIRSANVGVFEPGGFGVMRFVSPSADGSFVLNHLAPGKYQLAAETQTGFVTSMYGLDTTKPPAQQPYPEPVLTTGAVLDATAGSISGIDFRLPGNPGTISGVITRVCQPGEVTGCPPGTPVSVEGAIVNVRNYLDGAVGFTAYSQVDGSYALRGLAPGPYKLRVQPPNEAAGGLIVRYYTNPLGPGRTFDEGSFVTVQAGQDLGINMTLDAGSTFITGTVREGPPAFAPVVGTFVEARQVETGGRVFVALTRDDGSYVIEGLAPGNYRLRIFSLVREFVTQWYNDKSTRETGDVIAVAPSGAVGIDVFVSTANEGSLSGQIKHGASPVQGAGVFVYDLSGGFVRGSGATGKDGKFTVVGLAPGEYLAQARGLGFARQYLGGVPTQGLAQSFPITVEANADTPGHNFDLTLTSDIAGTISYAGQQTGALRISLFADAALTQALYSVVIQNPVFPQAYSFSVPAPDTQGVLPGTYYVGAFLDTNGNAVQDALEARGKFGGATPTSVSLVEGQIASERNFTLADGVASTGTSITAQIAQVLVPSTGSPSAALGNIEIRENGAGALLPAGRIEITLPAGLTFVGSPTVSTLVSAGLTVGAPAIEAGGQVFSFAVTQASTTGGARILISGLSVAVPAGFVTDGPPCEPIEDPTGRVCVAVTATSLGLTPAPRLHVATFQPPPAAPIITAVSIAAVGRGVTRTVTIEGANFDQLDFTPGHDTISFGEGIALVEGSIVVSADGKTITLQIVVAGNAPIGAHDVTITNNPSGDQLVLQSQFTVDPPPTVTAAGTVNATQPLRSPLTGEVLKGQTLTIIGTGFQPPTTVPSDLVVAFSGTGITVTAVSYTSATQISVDVEVAKAAELDSPRTVTVTNPDLGVGIGAGILTVLQASPGEPEGALPRPKTSPPPPAPPSVSSVVPSAAPTGALVTVNGSGFGSTLAAIAVTFAGPNGARLTGTLSSVQGGASLKVQVPATAVDGPVKVAVSGQQSSTSANFTVTNPLLSTVSPEGGMRTSQVLLDLVGAKFQAGATIALNPPNDLSLSALTIVDATHAQVTVTIGAAAALGFRDITVTNPDGASSTLLQAFEVKLNTPLSLVLSLKTVGAAQESVIDPGELLPSIQSVQVTLDATGKCTERRITPTLYLLEASFATSPATPPPSLTFTLTSSALPGTATNDDCEPNLALPEPLPAELDWSIGPVNGAVSVASQQLVVNNAGGVYRAWLASWDHGGSVRIDVTDSASAPTVTASLALPADVDKDGLPDAYEQNGALNGDKLGVNVLNFAKADVNGNGVPDGQDKFSADGLTNFEKYRGVYLVAPRAPTAGLQPLSSHQRLGAGKRNLFVRGRGFSTDPTLPDGMCGLNSATGAAVPMLDANFPCPKFQYGTAFDAIGVRIWDVTDSFDVAGTTVFPTKSLADPGKPMLDLATVTFDGANCSGGASCDHTSKLGTRQWNFPTLGFSTFGTPSLYGTALVLFRPIKAYFGDRPYLHQENLPGTFLPTALGSKPMLAPITVVCDKSSKGADNGSVQTGECSVNGVPGGDVYVAGAFDKDLSVMDVNNDGCVELPFVSDPTTLPICDRSSDSAASPQATFQQVIRSVVTHELGHAVGINIHTSDATDLMYMYSINWARDGHFSPQAGSLVQIHNKGGP